MMSVLAVPSDIAFCIAEHDARVLNQDTGGVLHALQKIRQAEAPTATPDRLRQLDARIERLSKRVAN